MNSKKLPTKLLNRLSFEIRQLSRRITYSECDSRIFQHIDCLETIENLLKFTQPQCLCDIGANAGNWAYVLREMNPRLEHIVFFEPQSKYQEQLRVLPLEGVTKVIYPYGLGEKKGELLIKGGTSSASFFEPDEQSLYFPNSLVEEQEKVAIMVLDEIYANNNLPIPDLIKLDVQGFELNVLKGGLNLLRQSKYLVIELSFRQFYKNQPFLWEILQLLQENAYVMVGKGFEWKSETNPSEILQMDAIFMNTNI